MPETIVLTGLAQGMGREVAKLIARGGDTVAGFDVDAEGISSLAEELKGIGGDHLLEVLDITDRPGILQFKDKVLQEHDRVHTIVSNVGIGFFGPFEEIDLDQALRCLEINVIGAAAIFQAFIPHLREQGGGKLVAMSSLVGRIPFPFESIYTASKFAIEGMLNSVRLELQPFNIHVGIIEPAQVSTSFAAKIHHLPPEGSSYRERVKRFIDRDNELIKSAPTPEVAAERIYKVIKAKKPSVHNQLEFKSTFFMGLNRVLPMALRDAILVNYMKIKE
ncbi:MAG: SDR family NAD(P)-dependent oxidoreductase [Bradymonadales bacterium]|nr:SDR family NAD(P)-dependent oxidoreductase [Bradymonadales bacterium]